MIWIQVRDVHAEHARLAAAGVPVVRAPAEEPWGLTEMHIEDPDGIRVILVEVPADHPLRRDPRPALPPGRRTARRTTTSSIETRPSTDPTAPATRQNRTFTLSASMHKHTASRSRAVACSKERQLREARR